MSYSIEQNIYIEVPNLHLLLFVRSLTPPEFDELSLLHEKNKTNDGGKISDSYITKFLFALLQKTYRCVKILSGRPDGVLCLDEILCEIDNCLNLIEQDDLILKILAVTRREIENQKIK